MAKAYVVAEIKVTNPQAYPEYLPLSTATVAQYGGAWKVRGGAREQREGEDEQHNGGWRTVILEFPSMEQARGWYDSVEYARAKAVRQANSIGRLFIVQGTD